MKNVSFKYENEKIIDNINFEIKKGQTIALVGQSGSGKSTIANLIPRFYDVSEGKISIDGINIKKINKNNLRGLIGLVSQDSILFNDTIINNIKLSKSETELDDIINSATIANADDFTRKFEKNTKTNVGDDKLS